MNSACAWMSVLDERRAILRIKNNLYIAVLPIVEEDLVVSRVEKRKSCQRTSSAPHCGIDPPTSSMVG